VAASEPKAKGMLNAEPPIKTLFPPFLPSTGLKAPDLTILDSSFIIAGRITIISLFDSVLFVSD